VDAGPSPPRWPPWGRNTGNRWVAEQVTALRRWYPRSSARRARTSTRELRRILKLRQVGSRLSCVAPSREGRRLAHRRLGTCSGRKRTGAVSAPALPAREVPGAIAHEARFARRVGPAVRQQPQASDHPGGSGRCLYSDRVTYKRAAAKFVAGGHLRVWRPLGPVIEQDPCEQHARSAVIEAV
jgi:hypothetical protein